MNYIDVREVFQFFDYVSYESEQIEDEICLRFCYRLISEKENKQIEFNHQVKYRLVLQEEADQAIKTIFYNKERLRELESFVFHIGLVEVINYWKLACPRVIRVSCGSLDENAVRWWKKLFYHGLGEFIYLNQMAAEVNEETFVQFEVRSKEHGHRVQNNEAVLSDEKGGKVVIETIGNLIPVGGGKDSVVTLEVLKKQKEQNLPFVMSAPQAAYDCIQVAGYDSYIEAKRIFDAKMMDMNREGYLNGHVPFSAILAFISSFAAALSGKRYIPLSNERSANEPSVIGTTFNHQYSKSYEFESDFDHYLHQYLTEDLEYFSLLRPLYEIQIGEMFAHYKAYHSVYRSCNRGKSSNSWCGKCAKCLFVYIILSPYLEKEELIRQFGTDLYDDPELEDIFDELIGIRETKPFECVGTIWEVRYALKLVLNNKNKDTKDRPLPWLLKHYIEIGADQLSTKAGEYEEENLVPVVHRRMLQEAMEVILGGVED